MNKKIKSDNDGDETKMASKMAHARSHKGAGGKVMKSGAQHPSNMRVRKQTGC